MSILILVEHDGVTLKHEFLKTLSAAKQIAKETGAAIDVIVFGYQCSAVTAQVAQLTSINQVFWVDDQSCQNQPEEHISQLLSDLAKDYSYILCSASSLGKNILPRAAAYLNVAHISGVSDIIAADIFIRPIYAGRLLTKVKSHDPIKILTIMASAFEDTIDIKEQGLNASDIIQLPMKKISLDNTAVFICENKSISKRPPLQSAAIVVAAGRGLQTKENFSAVEVLADKLDAAIGATRAVVDAGWMPNETQIGQTAKIVAPELYIALGISGATQHLAGMKNSKVIIAINKDVSAPIFQIAHYGLVADLNDVLLELNSLL